MKFNKEEKRIADSYEKGEWKKQKTNEDVYRTYAEAAIRKDKRINIRVSKKDPEGV